MSKKTHHEIVDVRPGADFVSLLVLSGEPHAILYADQAESLAIALVQATPGEKADVLLAAHDVEVERFARDSDADDLFVWQGEGDGLRVNRATAIALGLALIRAAAKAKEAK